MKILCSKKNCKKKPAYFDSETEKFYCQFHGFKWAETLRRRELAEENRLERLEQKEYARKHHKKRVTLEDIMNDNYDFNYGISLRNERLEEKGIKIIR